MIRNFNDVLKFAKERGPKTIAIACAQDPEVLKAIDDANKMGIANAILVGDKEKIEDIAKDKSIDLSKYEVIDIKDLSEASLKAVELVSTGKASSFLLALLIFQGLVQISIS